MDEITAASTGYGSTGGYSAGGWRLLLPRGGSGEFLRFATQVVIPSSVNVLIEAEGSGWGVRIKGEVDYAFKAEASGGGTFGPVEFSRIAFQDTGIQIDGNRRGMFHIHGCNFVDSPAPAIYGNGNSIVRGVIERNKFTGCAGSIQFAGTDVDLITVRQNDFVRGHTNPDVDLGTFFAVVDDNDFETRATADATVPWIRLIRGGNFITKNRFGDEEITGFAPPRDAIQIGPDTPDGASINGPTITHNVFRGTNGTPSSTNADSCVRLNAPVIGLTFSDNLLSEDADYNTAVINEAYIAALGSDIQKSCDNEYRGNRTYAALTAPEFSHGGLGFNFKPEWSGEEIARQNMVRIGTDLTDALWLTTNVTPTMAAVGPDGVANAACVLTKSSTGASHVRTQLQSVSSNTDGYISVVLWLRAGSLDRAQVRLIQSTDNYPLVNNRVLRLTSSWRKFVLRFANIDSAKSYFLYIGPSGITADDLAATGTIRVFRPSAWNGYSPPDFPLVNASTTQHAEMQFNALILGNRHIGYGTAAPGSGRYEQGDIVFDTAPAAAGTIGWVCVTAGSPGTWKTFGTIAA